MGYYGIKTIYTLIHMIKTQQSRCLAHTITREVQTNTLKC